MDLSRLLAPATHANLTQQQQQWQWQDDTHASTAVTAAAAPLATTNSLLQAYDDHVRVRTEAPPPPPLPLSLQPTMGAKKRGKRGKPNTTTQTLEPPEKRKRKSRLSAKQIQASRENQQDQSLLLNLTLDVNDLKQQVHDCLARKSMHETRSLLQRQRLCGAVLRATERFFHIFRTGFRVWEPREAAFFAATLDQQLVINSVVTGVDVFFEQWRRYKKLLHVYRIRTDSTHVLVSEGDSCVLECKGAFEGRVTLDAVQTLFPHILADRDLLARVVGARLVCPTRTLIYFDVRGRIVQYDAHADMFEALNRILATNPVDVITLMARARISAEGSMIPDSEDVTSDYDSQYDSTPDRVGSNAFVEGALESNTSHSSETSRSICRDHVSASARHHQHQHPVHELDATGVPLCDGSISSVGNPSSSSRTPPRSSVEFILSDNSTTG